MQITHHSARITQLGSGGVGDKAFNLILKEDDLSAVGFSIPQTYLLASDTLDEILRENGTDRKGAQERGVDVRYLPEFLTDVLQAISVEFGRSPIAVRSSGPGDASGNGVYESKIVSPNVTQLDAAVRAVVASYFSEHARAYRRGVALGTDAGVMIQPVAGRDRASYFAPTISGYAFTTAKGHEPLVNLVFGFGGGVQERNGVRIDVETLARHGNNFYTIMAKKLCSLGVFGAHTMHMPLTLHKEKVRGRAFAYGKHGLADGELQEVQMRLQRDSVEALRKSNLRDLFTRLKSLECSAGAPQYLEWVGVVNNGTLEFTVVQIADVAIAQRCTAPTDRKPIYIGHTVSGQGEKRCTTVVHCSTRDGLPELLAYNKNAPKDSFLLIYPASLVSQAHFGDPLLGLAHYSNAAVLLEVPDEQHVRDPIAHLAGEVSSLEKLFGVSSVDAKSLPRKTIQHAADPRYRKILVAGLQTTTYCCPVEDTLRVFSAT